MISTFACRGLYSDELFPKSRGDRLDKVRCLKAQVDIVDDTVTEQVSGIVKRFQRFSNVLLRSAEAEALHRS